MQEQSEEHLALGTAKTDDFFKIIYNYRKKIKSVNYNNLLDEDSLHRLPTKSIKLSEEEVGQSKLPNQEVLKSELQTKKSEKIFGAKSKTKRNIKERYKQSQDPDLITLWNQLWQFEKKYQIKPIHNEPVKDSSKQQQRSMVPEIKIQKEQMPKTVDYTTSIISQNLELIEHSELLYNYQSEYDPSNIYLRNYDEDYDFFDKFSQQFKH